MRLRAAAVASLICLSPPATAQLPGGAFQLQGSPAQGALLRGTAAPGLVSLTLDGTEVPVARDGRFLLGLDRDAPPVMRLVARMSDGRDLAETIGIAPRAWRLQHINMARPSTGPTPEYRVLRESELARIGAARARRTEAMGWAQRLIWPARGRISGQFGDQRIYRGGVPAAYHSGTDVAAGAGAIVIAPADGIVVLAPPPSFSLEGNLVVLDHGLGLSSAFLHLSSVSVRPGQAVRQGEPIGRVGATGRATGPHLHWSLVWNGARLDPQAVAGAMAGD